jgi:hypothetical protein
MNYMTEPAMEMEFKLKQVYDTTRTVAHSTNAVKLDDILEEFQMFLEGCGFVIDGSLMIVPDGAYYGSNSGSDISLD